MYDNIFKLSEIFESNIRENIEVNFKLSDECTEYVYSKFYDNVSHSTEWLTTIDNVNTFNDAIALTNYICTIYDKICCDKMIHDSLQTNLSKLSFKSLPIIPFK